MSAYGRTARLELRAPTGRDQEEFIAAVRASRRLHHPWVAPPRTPEAFAALLYRVRERAFEPMQWRARRAADARLRLARASAGSPAAGR